MNSSYRRPHRPALTNQNLTPASPQIIRYRSYTALASDGNNTTTNNNNDNIHEYNNKHQTEGSSLNQKQSSLSAPPVIIHQKMGFPAIENELNKSFRTRKSQNPNETADLIFPLSKMAFLICHLKDIHLPLNNTSSARSGDKNKKVATTAPPVMGYPIETLKTFGESFQNSVIVLIVNRESMSKLTQVQHYLLMDPTLNSLTPAKTKNCLSILLCNHIQHVATTVVNTVKSKDKDNLRMINLQTRKLQIQYVQSSVNEMGVKILLHCIPSLSTYQASVLLQGMGSLKAIANASSVQEILSKTPLDSKTAHSVFHFFQSCQR